MGVPLGLKRVRETMPYYRSSYVFVSRKQDDLHLNGFSDPSIGSRRIGLQILEEDFSPPSLPLIRYGYAAQLVGFESFGRNAGSIIHAVATQRVGLAVVWGPMAGYYAGRERIPLLLTPVRPVDSCIPFRYSMAVGVHQQDVALADALNRAIKDESRAITQILNTYHVPQMSEKDGGL